jgi:hypothetical protein
MSLLPVFPARLLWTWSKNGPISLKACSARRAAHLVVRRPPTHFPSIPALGGADSWRKFRLVVQQSIRVGNCFVVFGTGHQWWRRERGSGGGGGGGIGGGWQGNWRNFYRVAILCTRNGSPRGQVTLFFTLQYGQTAFRATSFPSPVDPTTRIPRWQSLQRKIFCIRPPSGNLAWKVLPS